MAHDSSLAGSDRTAARSASPGGAPGWVVGGACAGQRAVLSDSSSESLFSVTECRRACSRGLRRSGGPSSTWMEGMSKWTRSARWQREGRLRGWRGPPAHRRVGVGLGCSAPSPGACGSGAPRPLPKPIPRGRGRFTEEPPQLPGRAPLTPSSSVFRGEVAFGAGLRDLRLWGQTTPPPPVGPRTAAHLPVRPYCGH